mgnify:CR=1 FL=1
MKLRLHAVPLLAVLALSACAIGPQGGPEKDKTVALIKSPGLQAWDNWTVPMSMREVEPGVRLIMNTSHITDDHDWKPRPATKDED